MNKPVQSRTLKTRAKLIAAAQAVIAERGYEAMRVEEVVKRAGVAKGTFFAHFHDKDALMDQLIGQRIDQHLDQIETAPAPQNIEELIAIILPMLRFMTSERYVFDVILRHSGAAAIDTIGPIAHTFERQVIVQIGWFENGPFRRDVPAPLLAEGVLAFAVQAMSLAFCALHNSTDLEDQLKPYLNAWLLPPQQA